MEVSEAIKTRRSIRDFKAGNVSKKEVDKILVGMRHATSPSNVQPWKCVVLSREKINRMVDMIKNGRLDGLPPMYRDKALDAFTKVPYAVAVIQTMPGAACGRSIGAAIQNMLLISHSLGLGSVWLELEPILNIVKEVLRECGVQDENLIALVPIGRPADVQIDVMNRTKKKLEEFVTYL